jgi:hypothetical protein
MGMMGSLRMEMKMGKVSIYKHKPIEMALAFEKRI